MLFVHAKNLENKIHEDYKGKQAELIDFRDKYYIPFHNKMMEIDFSGGNMTDFKRATEIYNAYYKRLKEFIQKTELRLNPKWNPRYWKS